MKIASAIFYAELCHPIRGPPLNGFPVRFNHIQPIYTQAHPFGTPV